MSKNFRFILNTCRKYKKGIVFFENIDEKNLLFSISIFLYVNKIELHRKK